MAKSKMQVRGFFRLQLTEDRDGRLEVVGDTGWQPNTITTDGFNNYIAGAIGGASGSKQFGFFL